MLEFRDIHGRNIRLTDERRVHLETDHPEMKNQVGRISETLLDPDRITQSRTDIQAELFYKWYQTTPVTSKYLCIIVKTLPNDHFVLTAYHTDTIKQGALLWEKP